VRVEKGPKDGGSRSMLVRDSVPVYLGDGLRRADAERLASALLEPAELVCVKEAPGE
jgi:hypothetical protein